MVNQILDAFKQLLCFYCVPMTCINIFWPVMFNLTCIVFLQLWDYLPNKAGLVKYTSLRLT